ncbi:hypothetical protein GBW32_33310 [Streptomyces tsukubensis]|uniref:Uncharacterized protein n=1 Tax=Streptomyces tsukubensis TaxID=83656 RepID=A0A1V4A0E3_9ACTN|nr:hypothetical protein [Streptomyces tsukubensis]OON71766.1 hypothetical protein B1H18_32305 [Streptomyces tsukubensis]QFR97048.1 hypothetical protein GBW32_33310 [Streptomyces tsukubensis]
MGTSYAQPEPATRKERCSTTGAPLSQESTGRDRKVGQYFKEITATSAEEEMTAADPDHPGLRIYEPRV